MSVASLTLKQANQFIKSLPPYFIAVGSVVRKKKLPGDIDLLSLRPLKEARKYLEDHYDVLDKTEQGTTRSTYFIDLFKKPIGVNIWKADKKTLPITFFNHAYPSGWIIGQRRRLRNMKWKMNDYEIVDNKGKRHYPKNLRSLFKLLKLDYRSPAEEERKLLKKKIAPKKSRRYRGKGTKKTLQSTCFKLFPEDFKNFCNLNFPEFAGPKKKPKYIFQRPSKEKLFVNLPDGPLSSYLTYLLDQLHYEEDPKEIEVLNNLIKRELSYGKGGNFLSNIFNRISAVFTGPRKNAPPKVRKFLEQYGQGIITDIIVCREPINSTIDKVLNFITLGSFKRNKYKYNYDDMFHLFLFAHITAPNGEKFYARMEKNHVVNIEKGTRKGTCIPVDMKGKVIKVQDFVDNGLLYQGTDFWQYDPVYNNCQTFIMSLLEGNKLITADLAKFVKQCAVCVLEGPIRKIAKGITDIAGVLDVIIHGSGVCEFCTNV